MSVSTIETSGSDIVFEADDGYEIHGRWFSPDGPARGVVLVVPAMGVKSKFYAAFAGWMRDRGFAVMTFDYRGYGESQQGQLRGVEADAVRWAHDARDALSYAHQRADGVPITWIGHSFGGQVLPFANHGLVERAMTVAAGSGWWRLNSRGVRWRAPFLWKVLAPTAMAVVGYYPGRRLGVLDDLPRNVMRQWSGWCMSPDYILGEFPEMREEFASVTIPMVSLSFTDDELMSRESIAALDNLYTRANQVHMRFTPEQLDAEKVGHFGIFRHNQVDLWDEIVLPYLAERDAS